MDQQAATLVGLTRAQVRRHISRLFEEVSDAPKRDTDLLIETATAVSAFDWAVHHQETVTKAEVEALWPLIQRRLNHEPTAYITGNQAFWTLDLAVNPSTLIPRADSEALIRLGQRLVGQSAAAILDLGTGTGCLLLAALVELPEAKGIGVDISAEATALATENARRNSLADRVRFQTGSWFGPLSDRDGPFDLILSNPPYIEDGDVPDLMPDVRDYEPRQALGLGPTGLEAYEAIFASARHWLTQHGVLIFEVGDHAAPNVKALAARHKFEHAGSERDLAGFERALAFRPVAASPKKLGKAAAVE